MILAALTGVLYWLADARLFKETLEVSSTALMLLALGHAVAAIWHQLIKRDGTMDRMQYRVR